MNILHSSGKGGAESSALLGSQIRRRVLAVIVGVGVLGAMHVHHGALTRPLIMIEM